MIIMMTIFLIDGLFLKDNFFMTTNQKTYQPHNSVQVKMQPSTTHKSTCPLLSFGIAKSQVIIDNSNTDQVISSINLCISPISYILLSVYQWNVQTQNNIIDWTVRSACKLTQIKWKMGKETANKKMEDPHSLKSNEMAECVFEPIQPFVVDSFKNCEGLSRIALMEGNGVVMLGKVIACEAKPLK